MIQAMTQTTVISGSRRSQRLVFIADGTLYMSTELAIPVQGGSGSGIVSPSATPQLCQISGSGKVFIAERGADLQLFDASTGNMASFTATAGTAPTGCGLCCIYRNRLVVAGKSGDEQNFFASRQGTYTDWDYAETDPQAAWAGNSLKTGKLPDIITALIPISDDSLVMGGDHSITVMRGDPGYGGSIQQVSDKVGISGPEAWTTDPAGNLYFLGQDGLYRMGPAGGIENLSSMRLTDFFGALDRNEYYLQLRWDERHHGLWLFATTKNNDLSTHVFWDARNDAFFPMQFPHEFGPVSSLVWDADKSDDQTLMLGARNNLVQRQDDSATADDETAIASHVYLGPVRPAGDWRETKYIALDATLGEVPTGLSDSDFNLEWTANVGNTPYAALNDPAETRSGTFSVSGEQDPVGIRLTGQSLFVRLSNSTLDKVWSCERLNVQATPAGQEGL